MPKTLLILPALLAATLALADPGADAPLDALPYTPGLDTSAMDRSADPCDDLYQFACGGWIARNPIPADQARWSVYGKLADQNQRYLWGTLRQLAAGGPERSANQARLGDHFAACMDEAAVQAAGAQPLRPLLDRIDGLTDKRQLPALLAALQLATGSERLFFGFSAGQDYADASRQIAFAVAGGMGLPDRDYYLRPDARIAAIRQQYQAHVAQLFVLLGEPADTAQAHAATVLAVETTLARAALGTADKRDPYKTFHRFSHRGLQALTPGFDWAAYRGALGVADRPDVVNVTEPAFFKAFNALLGRLSLDQIRTYLRWQLTSSLGPFLSLPFEQAHFEFFERTLNGVPQPKPRWKRCVELVDVQLGEALGQEFVARNFTPGLKQAALTMTTQIEAAMARRIQGLDWMSATTKARALAKLATLVNKIGYPERWRDYSGLPVRRDQFLANVVAGQAFEARRQLAKIGQPLDRGEWAMTPQTVNAYYSAQLNDINFPAAVLQPPLYDARMDDAPNYGNTGGTIGHELIHGFDDEGRQFDAQGNLRNWWTRRDSRAFDQRAACVANQYKTYTIVDDIKINPKLTLGEDLADFGGLVLAWEAWKAQVATQTPTPQTPATIDGLTPAQRFFVGFAQWDCNDARPETLRVKALTDPHSPGRYRINGVVVNMPEFEQAFACKPSARLVKPDTQRCRLW